MPKCNFTPKWVLTGIQQSCNFASENNRSLNHHQIKFFILSCTKVGAFLCSLLFSGVFIPESLFTSAAFVRFRSKPYPFCISFVCSLRFANCLLVRQTSTASIFLFLCISNPKGVVIIFSLHSIALLYPFLGIFKERAELKFVKTLTPWPLS